MLPQLTQAVEEELQELRSEHRLRALTVLDSLDGVTAHIEGQPLTLWCTNDYLGLSVHPRVIAAAAEAAQRWGVGARASRLLAGTTALHVRLEQRLAEFFGAEAALVYPSGYLANLGTLTALLGRGDAVVIDRLAHASLVDACRLSRATLRVFHHNDPAHLATVLSRLPAPSSASKTRRRVVITEGVFSMEGDHAPLPELMRVARRAEALLYVDDAHAAFACGATGRGTPEVQGVKVGDFLYIGTLGKALGCQGGFVVGSRTVIELLQNRARPFIYTTALAPPMVGAALAALKLLREGPSLQQRLADRVQCLQRLMPELSVRSHIVPVVLGSASKALAAADRLRQRGHFAPAIRPPTVPANQARLRLSLSVLHTDAQLASLAEALQ